MSLNGIYSDDFEELLDDNEHNQSPLILLMGPRGSGKTSIQRVLFNKLSPHETNFVEHTTAPYGMIYPPPSPKTNSEALLRCRIIDFPGNTNFQKHPTPLIERLLLSASSIVYVVDASFDETWADASENLIGLLSMVEALGVTPFISVLLHKIDPDLLSNDSNRSTYTDLRRALIDDLRSSNVRQSVTFYVTSLFDASIYETFSRIVQQLIPQVNLLEHLLDGFNSSSGMERVFLVDLNSKLYLATDSSTPDVTLYELLSDLLDMVFDLCSVYSPLVSEASKPEGGDRIDSTEDAILMPASSTRSGSAAHSDGADPSGAPLDDSDCVDAEIQLNNSYTLHLRQFNSHLALLFVYRKSSHQQHAVHHRTGAGTSTRPRPQHNNSGLIEYNVTCLKQAISALFNIDAYGLPRSRRSIGAVRSSSSLGFGGGDDVNYGILSYMGSMASTNALTNMKNLYAKVGTYGAGSVGMGGMSYINSNLGLISSPSNHGAFPVGSSRAQGSVDFSTDSFQHQSTTHGGAPRQNTTTMVGSYSGLGSLPMVNHNRHSQGGPGSYTSPQRK